MKVMLLKDVYKLGRAGDVKKVADGYGRNYLLPQGLAVLATPGVLKQSERIREHAAKERVRLNQELGDIADRLNDLELTFAVKAGETGRLYGSVTTAMIAEEIEKATGAKILRRQIDTQPIKMLGVHVVDVRLTIDLVPGVKVVVHREGEPPESAYALAEELIAEVEEVEDFADLKAELEAEEAALEAMAETEELADEHAATEEQETAGGEEQTIADDA